MCGHGGSWGVGTKATNDSSCNVPRTFLILALGPRKLLQPWTNWDSRSPLVGSGLTEPVGCGFPCPIGTSRAPESDRAVGISISVVHFFTPVPSCVLCLWKALNQCCLNWNNMTPRTYFKPHCHRGKGRKEGTSIELLECSRAWARCFICIDLSKPICRILKNVYFWLCQVLVQQAGYSLQHVDLSLVLVGRLSCPSAYGILVQDQGWNPCPRNWEANSYPLDHQGSPYGGI